MTTHTLIESEIPRRLSAADLAPRGRVFPSPSHWRDQIFYQLLPGRFSDGREATRPVTPDDGVWPQEFQNIDCHPANEDPANSQPASRVSSGHEG